MAEQAYKNAIDTLQEAAEALAEFRPPTVGAYQVGKISRAAARRTLKVFIRELAPLFQQNTDGEGVDILAPATLMLLADTVPEALDDIVQSACPQMDLETVDADIFLLVAATALAITFIDNQAVRAFSVIAPFAGRVAINENTPGSNDAPSNAEPKVDTPAS